MNGADEVIPRMAGGEVADPIFVARDVIDLKSELDIKLRKIAAGFVHLVDVFIELIEPHAPVIKIVAIHGTMIGHTDFAQAEFYRLSGIFGGFADCMLAEGRVHVIIRG